MNLSLSRFVRDWVFFQHKNFPNKEQIDVTHNLIIVILCLLMIVSRQRAQNLHPNKISKVDIQTKCHHLLFMHPLVVGTCFFIQGRKYATFMPTEMRFFDVKVQTVEEDKIPAKYFVLFQVISMGPKKQLIETG